jgi:acyl-CoA thioesterase FadM
MDVPVPYTAFSMTVPDTFLDFNGHVNDAAYAQVLTDANESFLGWLGLSEQYRRESGGALFTVELTIRFLHEVGRAAVLSAHSLVASNDTKRLRLHTTIVDSEGTAVAVGETLYLHVDAGGSGRVAPFPADRQAVLDEVAAAHHHAHAEASAR